MSDKSVMRTVPWLFSWMMFCAAVTAARGQGGGGGSGGGGAVPGSRVLCTFDFEETKLGNYENTPMYWSKVVGRGYPAYSAGKFDHSVFRSSNTSFMLQTDGGSVAYRYAPPPEKRIPIQAHADYYILAFVRTSQLKHARADLTAWFADEQGNLILPTEVHSQPYVPAEGAPVNGDAWQVLYIFLPGPDLSTAAGAKAKSLVLQMGLSQPQQLGAAGDDGLGKFAIYQQDIQGAVWFDDLAVLQMPRVGVGTHQAANSTAPEGVFGPGEPVELDMELSDLTRSAGGGGKTLRTRMRVINSDGLLMAQQEWQAQPTPDQGWSQRFTHAPLPAGQYTATMEVTDADGGSLMARRQTQFLCLPEGTRTTLPAPEFGLGAASYTDTNLWGELPLLLRQTGAGAIQLPVWRRDIPEDSLSKRDPQLEGLLGILQRQNVRVIGAFSEVPAFLQAKITPLTGVDRSSVLTLLNSDTGVWWPSMSFLLTRYSNRFDWWELGSPEVPFSGTLAGGGGAASAADPALADRSTQLYARTHGEMGKMLNQPALVIPWNALLDFEAARFPHAVLDLHLPAVIKPGQIPAYLDNFRGSAAATQPGAGAGRGGRAPIFAHLEGLDPRATPREDRLADFAQRIVYAAVSRPESILYDVAHGRPDELLLVYGKMIRALAGTQFQAELPLVSGTHAFLFRRTGGLGGSTLVLWSDSAGAETPLDLPLGPAPRTSDLLGNPRTLKTDAATRLTHVSASTTPLVMENVESQILELTSSFALDTPVLPAGAGAVQTQVLLRNPYGDSLTGSLRVTPPHGWTADPPSLPVSLPAGGTLKREITLRYPFTENAGRKILGGRLTLDPGNPAGMSQLDVAFPVHVSSQLVDMDGFTRVDENGDILIQQVITNTSSSPLDAQAYVLVPGFARQQRYIVGLLPNQSTVKRFAFSPRDFVGDAPGPVTPAMIAQKLTGASATLGVRQNDGQTMLTKSVPLE